MNLAGSRNPEYGMNKSNENRRVGWNQFPGLEGIARGSEFILKPSWVIRRMVGRNGLFFKASLWLPRGEWTVEIEARQKIGKLVRGLLLWPRDELVTTGTKGMYP